MDEAIALCGLGGADCPARCYSPDKATGSTQPSSWSRDLPLAILTAMASQYRIEMLEMLAVAPRDVSSLAEDLSIGVQSASYHLRLLKEGGFVVWERDKTRHIFRLSEHVQISAGSHRICAIVTVTGDDKVVVSLPRIARRPLALAID